MNYCDIINCKSPDLHIHSVFSDGSDTPKSLIENVKRAGLDVFALTDHDTYAGCAEVKKLLGEFDPYFIPGVELSCEGERGKYHILGYCYDVNKPSIREAVEYTHGVRLRKVDRRFDFLTENYGFKFTEEDRKLILSQENPGKPHFVNLMLKKGYITEKSKGFDILSGCKNTERVISPEEAINAIYGADGIPVLAHGILADGSKYLTNDEIETRVSELKNCGLMGLECYYSSYTPLQKEVMLKLAKKYNLLITAGSDYHGTNKTVKLGQTNNPQSEDMRRFYQTVKRLL